jgi:hypothetical protein
VAGCGDAGGGACSGAGAVSQVEPPLESLPRRVRKRSTTLAATFGTTEEVTAGGGAAHDALQDGPPGAGAGTAAPREAR